MFARMSGKVVAVLAVAGATVGLTQEAQARLLKAGQMVQPSAYAEVAGRDFVPALHEDGRNDARLWQIGEGGDSNILINNPGKGAWGGNVVWKRDARNKKKRAAREKRQSKAARKPGAKPGAAKKSDAKPKMHAAKKKEPLRLRARYQKGEKKRKTYNFSIGMGRKF